MNSQQQQQQPEACRTDASYLYGGGSNHQQQQQPQPYNYPASAKVSNPAGTGGGGLIVPAPSAQLYASDIYPSTAPPTVIQYNSNASTTYPGAADSFVIANSSNAVPAAGASQDYPTYYQLPPPDQQQAYGFSQGALPMLVGQRTANGVSAAPQACSDGGSPLGHQVLTCVAEGWMQTFYTLLSNDPNSVTPLYLPDAQVIYTGQEINVDAELMTGVQEISAFFSSPSASKFRNMRVIVDALHPLWSMARTASPLESGNGYHHHPQQANPAAQQSKNPFTCVTVFLKGRVWLQASPSGRFMHTVFFHNLLLFLGPGGAGSYRVATEHFHLAQLPLRTRPPSLSPLLYQASFQPSPAPYFATSDNLSQPTAAAGLRVGAPRTVNAEPEAPGVIKDSNVENKDAVTPIPTASLPTSGNKRVSDNATQHARHTGGGGGDHSNMAPRQTGGEGNAHTRQTGDTSVHALPENDGLITLSDGELKQHLNEAFAAVGLHLEPTLAEFVAAVVRPPQGSYSGMGPRRRHYFFVNMSSIALRDAVLNRGSLAVKGVQVRFSNLRPSRYQKPYGSKAPDSQERSESNGKSLENVRKSSLDGKQAQQQQQQQQHDSQNHPPPPPPQRRSHYFQHDHKGRTKRTPSLEKNSRSQGGGETSQQPGSEATAGRTNKPPRVVSLTSSSNMRKFPSGTLLSSSNSNPRSGATNNSRTSAFVRHGKNETTTSGTTAAGKSTINQAQQANTRETLAG